MDFQSAKSFGKLRLRAFQPYHLYYICRHCRYKTRISNAFNAIYVDTVDTKIKAMLLCYCVLSRVSCLSTLSIQRSKHPMHLMLCLCRHCQYKDQSNATYCVLSRVSCLSTLSIQRSKHPMHLMLCLCRHCRYKDQSNAIVY